MHNTRAVQLALCTFTWTYSRNLFDGVLCALLLLIAFRYLLKYRRSGGAWSVAASFASLGLAVDTRLSMAVPAAAGLVFVGLCRTDGRVRGVLIAMATLAPFAAWQLWYNNLRTGNPLFSPVQTAQYADNNAMDGDLLNGLAGLFFSPGKSVFIYAPVLLLSALGSRTFWLRDRGCALLVAAVGLLWLLLHAKLRSWYGAAGWGPRHMITVLPLLALPGLAVLPQLWTFAWWRASVTACGTVGFVLAAASMVGNWHYRMVLAGEQGRLTDGLFIWSIGTNQAADMLVGVANNLLVLAGRGEPAIVPAASAINTYASNRLNFWWFTFHRAGIPAPAVVAAALALVGGACYSAIQLFRGGGAKCKLVQFCFYLSRSHT